MSATASTMERCWSFGSGSWQSRCRRRCTGSSTRSSTAAPACAWCCSDNERGKGDHKHLREVESAYVFESVERLMADFLGAVRAVRAEEEA